MVRIDDVVTGLVTKKNIVATQATPSEVAMAIGSISAKRL
jgi:hypothetical protein